MPPPEKDDTTENPPKHAPRENEDSTKKRGDQEVDETLDESFPASDPPSWTAR